MHIRLTQREFWNTDSGPHPKPANSDSGGEPREHACLTNSPGDFFSPSSTNLGNQLQPWGTTFNKLCLIHVNQFIYSSKFYLSMASQMKIWKGLLRTLILTT